MAEDIRKIMVNALHRPHLFSTIVIIYLAGMSVGAAYTLAQYLYWYLYVRLTEVTSGPGPDFYILPLAGPIGISALGIVMLVSDIGGSLQRGFLYASLFMWSLVTAFLIFAAFASFGEAALKGIPVTSEYPTFIAVYLLGAANGLMYLFVRERYSLPRHGFNNKRFVLILAIPLTAVFVFLVAVYFALYSPSLSYQITAQVPNSIFTEPVRASAQSSAFFSKYPRSSISVDQSALAAHANCCTVTISHFKNASDSGIQLIVQVKLVTGGLSAKGVVDSMKLWCISHQGGWTVRGDIVQNLQRTIPDCWDVGPPPKPSNQQLIEMASNTIAGRGYLARYAENNIDVHYDFYMSGTKVTFTPKMAEPIEYVVVFAGLDYVISETHIVCSNGAYRYPTDPNFESYLHPNNDCLAPVHDKLVVASETPQAMAFMAKYPAVGLHRTDFTSEFTVTGNSSTIKYMFNGIQQPANVSRLFIVFKPGTNVIANFEIQCEPDVPYTEMPTQHSESGKNVDVAKFLQHSYCPSP